MLAQINVEYDYNKFKLLSTNRDVLDNKKMIKSISEHDITPYVPILVDKQFHILDGQHRFDACKKLGKPIYYIIYYGSESSEDIMVCLNSCLKVWRQEEWISYYYKKGIPVYVRFVEMSRKYNLGVSNNILLFSMSKCNASDVKKGNLKDFSTYFEPVYNFITGIEYPNKTYRPFVAALLRFFIDYGNDKKRLLKLKRKIMCVPRYSRLEDYYNAFVNLTTR